MTVSSAPGKVYLFGEHAVVYGEPAIPCAIDRRATVTVEPRDDSRVRVEASDLSLDGFTVEFGGDEGFAPAVDVSQELIDAAMGYIDAAVNEARDVTNAPDAGFSVTIESDIPLGAGLGSSAAVTVAAIDAATRALGKELAPVELADRAYRAEYTVQDGQASRADTYCSALGGVVRVQGDAVDRLTTTDLPLVVGFDGGAGETGSQVSKVRQLKDEYPSVAEAVSAIGTLVSDGESRLKQHNLEEIGRLMDCNHGLLSALGVSAPTLDAMVWAARNGGAYGAKLTGAGGGGCIVALGDSDSVLTALETNPVCERAFRANLAQTGVQREDE